MVTQRAMTIDRFVPNVRQAAQQPLPQSQGQMPPLPPPPQTGWVRKGQRVAEQTSTSPGDIATQTPPRPTGGIVIQESQIQARTSVASSSKAAQAWQPKFLLDGKPLSASTCVQVWEKGEGGCVSQSLTQGLLLPEDVHAF